MKLNQGVLAAVVMMMGALGMAGCHKSSDASSDDKSTAATEASAADDQDADETTGESGVEFASAERRLGGGWGRGHRPGRREGIRHERRELRGEIGRDRRQMERDRREIGRDRRELGRERPWRDGDRR